MKKIALMSLVASSVLMASGYKIPETSTNAVALGAANIAHNHENADAAYYNPAKMVFMKDTNNLEVDLTYIGLEKVKWKPNTGNEIKSESEDFIIPTLNQHHFWETQGVKPIRVPGAHLPFFQWNSWQELIDA